MPLIPLPIPYQLQNFPFSSKAFAFLAAKRKPKKVQYFAEHKHLYTRGKYKKQLSMICKI